MRILYLAHDLDDAAIWRRVAMLRRGGAEVRVAGFRRGAGPLAAPAEVPVTLLGRTRDGRLAARALQVLRTLPAIGARARRLMAGQAPDVVIARNLEMLLLARAAQRGFSAAPACVYELLDIHRAMLGTGPAGRVLRALEAALLRATALVWISSPGFETHYLRPFDRPVAALRLIENKPLTAATAQEIPAPRRDPIEPGRVVIGWFGILRCRWSLETLDALTRAAPGRYRVILRGRPARDVLPDFDAVVAANPDLGFHGPYRWPEDLAAIYSECDLSWLIDRFDAGANSDWLLPNRLYEGGRHGAAPIALATTELGRRLAALGAGLLIGAATPDAVRARLAALDADAIRRERDRIAALPHRTWEADTEECAAVVEQLRQICAGPGRTCPQPAAPLPDAGTRA